MTLEDKSGMIDAVVFPGEYSRFRERLQTGNVIYLTGKKSDQNSVICEQIRQDTELSAMLMHMQLCIKLNSQKQAELHQIQEICRKFPGHTELVFYLETTRKYISPRNRVSVTITPELYQQLTQIISPEHIGCIPGISSQKN